MASGYYVHKDILTTNQQETFKNYFNEDYIALEDLFETSNYTTTSLDTLSKYTSATDTFKYVPTNLGSEWSSRLTLNDYFGPNLSGVLRGESPTFKTCVFDSTSTSAKTLKFNISDDRSAIIVKDSGDGEITRIAASKFPNSFLPNKLLFVIQGAGGGGGGELSASSGFGGASGGLVAVVGDVSDNDGITVKLGTGGAGGAAGSKKNGSDGGQSTYMDYNGTIKINGGQGGHYAFAGGSDSKAKGGTVELTGDGYHSIVVMQNGSAGGVNETTATTTSGQTQQGQVFPISEIDLSNASLTNATLSSSGSRGSTSSATAGSGAGSFFGNGGAAGKNNSGSDNAGKNGTYGAGGGGGGNATLNDTYGKGGNGGDAVLKVYY